MDLENGIAIIGTHCLFPGASSTRQFWERLCDGYEAVDDFSDDILLQRGVPKVLLDNPKYVKAGIQLDGMDEFDYSFFGVSPKEAAIMDPQHRKFLECCWAALENSGHKPTDVDASIGMFAGSGMPWYLIRNVLTHKTMVDEMGEFLIRHTANDKDFLATRVSFSMNIHGPSLSVQTACSTSLVAVHLAMQSLLSNECDIAIAGGATIEIPNGTGYLYREEEVRSADGRCRAFDKDADGTVFGSGSGAVVLRRIEDALADGDSIQAVLLGSAINNDGSEKAGYMAPSVDYQAQAIAEAMAVADVLPEAIGYFETHGTGTKIGDPIEVAALTQAFGDTTKKQFCGLGSVKTNIGHLDTAAGIASLIKVVQCLKHKTLPASLHFRAANPEIDFDNSPFYVNSEKKDWPDQMIPRIAGVSSLGVGGTNAHIVACEAPLCETSAPPTGSYILPLSAKTTTALQRSIENLLLHLQQEPDINIADLAYTLQEGRVEFENRAAVVCDSQAHAITQLTNGSLTFGAAPAASPDLVFMFSGQGTQYPGMGSGIYANYPTYRTIVDECCEMLRHIGGPDLQEVLFADRDDESVATLLEDTAIAQPALFVLEYALARLLMSWGLQPSSMIGHSLGEYVAATIAGVFTLEQALGLVNLRGKLIGGLPGGSMIAVPSSAASLEKYLSQNIEIAAINARDLTVLSGPAADIRTLLDKLISDGLGGQILKTSHAFHSAMLEPVLDEFTSAVRQLNPQAPQIPFVSNVSGTWISDDQAQSASYWAQHMRKTVNFLDGLQTLSDSRNGIFLEIGPGHTLTNLASMAHSGQKQHQAFSCLPHAKDVSKDASILLAARAGLWTHGFKTDWSADRSIGRRQRLQLPTYPFDKHRCWLNPIASKSIVNSVSERSPLSKWGYVANWRLQLPPNVNTESIYKHILVFANDTELGNRLISDVRNCCQQTTVVRPGIALEKLDDDTYCIDSQSSAQHAELIESFTECPPTMIIHALNADDAQSDNAMISTSENVDAELKKGFFSLMNLAKGIQNSTVDAKFRILVITSDMFSVAGEPLQPIKATVLGPVRVIPNEIPEIRVQLIDISSSDIQSDIAGISTRILDEMKADSNASEIVYRGPSRYCQVYDSVTIPEVQSKDIPLKQNGVYLITGGFGGLGRSLAEWLANNYRARLVMLGRPRETRHSSHADENGREQFIQLLEQLGSEVHRIEVDITDSSSLSDAFGLVKQRFGEIDGIFHAAGRLDDALLSVKNNASAYNVLVPKVRGTLALEQTLSDHRPDFHIYFSSISGLAGLPGQIDYVAANTFLDAFAQEKNKQGSCKHLSIGWSSWTNSGMASRANTEARLPRSIRENLETLSHSIFSYVRQRDDGVDFFGEVSSSKLWYLDEHRLLSGQAILPGTAYIELIVSAYSVWKGTGPIRLEDLIYAVPLQLHDGESTVLHLEYAIDSNDNCEVTVSSWSKSGDMPLEHVRAKISSMTDADRPVAASHSARESISGDTPVTVSNPLLKFGERWDCLESKIVSNEFATLHLKLPEGLQSDFLDAPLHPAMMDIAIGGAPELFIDSEDAKGGLVPFMIRSVSIWEPLQSRVTSHVTRLASDNDNSPEADIRIESDSGDVLADIRGFCMRKLKAEQLDNASMPEPSTIRPIDQSDILGISAVEGIEVMTRLLAIESPANVVVAPYELSELLRDLRQRFSEDDNTDTESSESMNLSSRPSLATIYAAAESDQEKVIAAMWQNALGFSDVGIDDNFFELGGHSLLLTQLVSKIRREHKLALPLEKAFDQLTVRKWARMAKDLTAAQLESSMKISRANRKTLRTDSSLLKRLQ